MQPVSKVRFTRKDSYELPEDWRGELIAGDLVMPPAPDPSHQLLVGRLHLELCKSLPPHRVLLSPTDVDIDDESVLQPDLLVLPENAKPTKRPWTIPPPIWVAEILSPGTAHRDRGVKLKIYARKGIREAWILDPDAETIEVHDLTARTARIFESTETAPSGVLRPFVIRVASFFAL